MGRTSPTESRYPLLALTIGLGAGAAAGAAAFAVGLALPPSLAIAVVVGVFIASSIKYADQWEKAVVMRMGRYRGLRGPGFFGIIPLMDRVSYHIDQRIRTSAFDAESCLTRDTVPVDVDAIAFWVVHNAEEAALEVQDYEQAVLLAAQSALRDAIGKHDLEELIQSRQELGAGLRESLDRKMHNWGIQVQSVEIRDVIIPEALEEAMSRHAQAERERQARIILGTAETEIAEKFVIAAEKYETNPVAMNLRAMNMLYESIVKRGSLMVVPSGLADSLNLPGIMGMVGASGLANDAKVGDGAAEKTHSSPAESGDGEPGDPAAGSTPPMPR